MTIWQKLAPKKITPGDAIALFNAGHYVGVLTTKHDGGTVFNPAHKGFLHKTSILDAQDDLRELSGAGGACEWYDLNEWAQRFNFVQPHSSFGLGSLTH